MKEETFQPVKPIKAVEQEIIQEFESLEDIDAKYSYLFELGYSLPEMDPSLKNEDTLVDGCQSKLWFHLKNEHGRLFLKADSDSMVIRGITALLVRLIAGRSPEEVQAIRLDFIDQLDIWKLASERNNGLMAMLDHLHQQAKRIMQDTQQMKDSA